MQRERRVCGFLLALFALSLTTGLSAATTVKLTVTERQGVDRVKEPVTSGIPIPKGQLASVKTARLLLGGKEVPAQFRAAGLWRPGDSIKWLLVDLQADVKANETLTYTLEYGDGVAARVRPAAQVKVTETDDAYVVATGAATFTVSKSVFSLFDGVTLGKGAPIVAQGKTPQPAAVLRKVRRMVTRAIPGAKNTGRSHLVTVLSTDKAAFEDYTLTYVTDREFEVVGARTGNQGKGAYLQNFTSKDAVISIPGNQWLRYAAPRKGDTYTFRTIPAGSSFGSEGVVRTDVLERGPLRCVIRVKGSFGPVTAPAMEYTARYHFYAGSARVRLLFTLENNDFGGRTNTGNADNCNIGGINCVFFDGMTLRLPLSVGAKARVHVGGEAKSDPVVVGLNARTEIYQDSNGGAHWNRYQYKRYHPRPNSYVTFKGYKILSGGVGVAKGDRALGWLDVSGAAHGLTVAVRDFWQNFPNALAANADGSVEVGLFPARYAGDFPFRSGEHKTHEVLLQFHSGAPAPGGNRALAQGFSDPLRLEPTPQWFARTRALGDLHPFDMANYGAYEIRNQSVIGISPEPARQRLSLFSRREQFDFYGWMDYGDVAMDFEGGSGQWGMKYDLDYFMALHYARSLNPLWWQVFIAGSRHHCDIDVHHQPHYPWVHYVRGGSWAHSQHNEGGNRNPNRNRGRFTKDLCFGARGAATRHYLTGDWRAREVCLEQADNALARYMSPQTDPGEPGRNNRLGWRGDACTLNRLLEGYLLTGEQRFLQRTRWQIRSCAFNGRPPRHGPVSLWSSTFYIMALARYVEIFPEDAAARSYLLAHFETLYKGCNRPELMMYRLTPQPDGSVVGSGQTSMYNVMGADALATAYRLTGERRYVDLARRCFAYGVRNACWRNGPATYYHIHSANGALHGNMFMAVDSALRAQEGGAK